MRAWKTYVHFRDTEPEEGAEQWHHNMRVYWQHASGVAEMLRSNNYPIGWRKNGKSV